MKSPTRSRRAAASLAGVALAMSFALITVACAATPDQDAFYTPPAPLPASNPGDIIRSRASQFTTDALGQTPVAGIQAWQVLYRSVNATGAAIPVSGMVLVPSAPWTGPGRRPLVAYGVGTRGIGDKCAPSYTLAHSFDYEAGLINKALSKGWAVAVSDMEGLGTPGIHTYEVGRSQGRALLDVARAAERLPGTGLDQSTPVGIWGYSQGGTTAGWAAELASTYAPDLQLKGVAAGGVPSDLRAVAQNLDGQGAFAFALFAAAGYDAAYPELQLRSYLNAAGNDLYTNMQTTCLVSVDGIVNVLGTAWKHFSDLTTTNPLDTPAWKARLDQNKLGSGRPTVPVFQYHAHDDELIPLGQAADVRDAWCAKGVKVTWAVYGDAEHALGLSTGAPDAVKFLDDRFRGAPATSNC